MSEYKYVVAIDAGYRNFAVCAVDNTDWQAPATWYAEDLWRKRPGRRSEPDKNDCVEIALLWIKRNKAMLDKADAVILVRSLFIIALPVSSPCMFPLFDHGFHICSIHFAMAFCIVAMHAFANN